MYPAGGFGGGRTGWNGQREIICPPLPAFLPAQISSALQGRLHGGLDSLSPWASCLKPFPSLQYSLSTPPSYPSATSYYLLLQERSRTPKVLIADSF